MFVMNGTGKLVLMAVIGILVAAAIIGTVTYLNTTLPSGNTTSTVTSKITLHSTTTTILTSTTVSISNSTTPEASLDTQIADLLSLPAGVTHVYLTYSDIEVHTFTDNASSWFRVATGNDVDLASLSSDAVTVGIARIPSGYYDAARLTIVSATVTFDGSNITAIVPETVVSASILQNGIDLLPNATLGLVFDFAPSVVPAQSSNGTQFQLLPYAEALEIPSSVPAADYNSFGSVIQLDSQPWFTSTQVELAGNVTILAALVTNNAMLVVIKNTGNATVTINGLSVLTPITSNFETETIVSTITTVTTITTVVPNSSAAASPLRDSRKDPKNTESLTDAPVSDPLAEFQTVASFFVLDNGQVIQSSSGVNAQQVGLILAPGQNASLTFIGNIQTLNSISAPYSPLQIVSGFQYGLEIQGPFGQYDEINVSAVSPFF